MLVLSLPLPPLTSSFPSNISAVAGQNMLWTVLVTCSGAPFLTETSVRSPRTILYFHDLKHISWIKVSPKACCLILKTEALGVTSRRYTCRLTQFLCALSWFSERNKQAYKPDSTECLQTWWRHDGAISRYDIWLKQALPRHDFIPYRRWLFNIANAQLSPETADFSSPPMFNCL